VKEVVKAESKIGGLFNTFTLKNQSFNPEVLHLGSPQKLSLGSTFKVTLIE
jgi:hypothetical protein